MMITMITMMMTTMITTRLVMMITMIMIKGSALHGLHRQLAATLQVVSQQQPITQCFQCNALRLRAMAGVPVVQFQQDQQSAQSVLSGPDSPDGFFLQVSDAALQRRLQSRRPCSLTARLPSLSPPPPSPRLLPRT